MSTQEYHQFTFKDVPQDFQTITKKLEKISIKYEKEINKIIFNKLCIAIRFIKRHFRQVC